jgi:hypothetical protein
MKLQSIIQGMVLAAIVLVASRAFAQPVNLVCKYSPDAISAVRITFDEQSGTAFLGDDPASPASFTATNIKWSGLYANYPEAAFNLDRISGVLTVDRVSGKYSGLPTTHCVVAEKKF